MSDHLQQSISASLQNELDSFKISETLAVLLFLLECDDSVEGEWLVAQ